MKKPLLLVLSFLAASPVLADMPPATGLFLRFSCKAADAANPPVQVLAAGGEEFALADLAREGYGLSIDGGRVKIALLSTPWDAAVVGARSESEVRCQSDPWDAEHYPSYLSVVAPAAGLTVAKTVKVLSACRPLNYNMAGVANWGRDEAVTIVLSGIKNSSDIALSKLEVRSFGSLAACEK